MLNENIKILITGGAGFIGSNLCEYFLSKGYKVVCLDNFATGHRHNLEAFSDNENFQDAYSFIYSRNRSITQGLRSR